MSLRWWSSCRTNAGRIRKINEDAYLERFDLGLWLVADGMGGHEKGDEASRILVDSLEDCPAPKSLEEFVDSVKERLSLANRRVRKAASRIGPYKLMGSTVVALLAYQGECVCLWAGDSRAYLFRGGQLKQVSRDHSLVEQMITRGELSREEASRHPIANRINRAVGTHDNLVLDERRFELLDGDSVLLCTDGLNKELSDQEIASVVNAYECEEASQELLDLSLERGARDNVTLALIRFEVTTGYGDTDRDITSINPASYGRNLGVADRVFFPQGLSVSRSQSIPHG